jgi:hypothetical protein
VINAKLVKFAISVDKWHSYNSSKWQFFPKDKNSCEPRRVGYTQKKAPNFPQRKIHDQVALKSARKHFGAAG